MRQLYVTAAALAVVLVGGCDHGRPTFEIMGIKLDDTTLQAVSAMHPAMRCGAGASAIIPGYTQCRVNDVDVAGIRSSLGIEADKSGVVTAVTVHGQPYDGPLAKFSRAMNEKYGSPQKEEKGQAMWEGANGSAVLLGASDGTALLRFEGERWRRDAEALGRDFQKGKKF